MEDGVIKRKLKGGKLLLEKVTKYKRHQGSKEKARRLKQMEKK